MRFDQDRKDFLAKSFTAITRTFAWIVAVLFVYMILIGLPDTELPELAKAEKVYADVPWDAAAFDGVDYLNPALNEQVAFGRKLITATADHIGPGTSRPFAGNNLNCSSCHLEGGGKPFAAPFVTVPSQFPQYRGREDKIGTLAERINGCMQRSMNGKPLPEESEEMAAMIAYMEWLSLDKPKGEKVKGNKFLSVKAPDRAVDLRHGAEVFEAHCTRCHGNEGKGVRNAGSFTYLYPPLWGPDSYNDGAGMHRVLTAAQFIKGNMPLGTTADEPLLTDEEAYDVAGYINSFTRPSKPNKELDFPDLKKKPMSTPYGPWADPFSAEQHKYGPYNEIAAFYESEFGMKKTK